MFNNYTIIDNLLRLTINDLKRLGLSKDVIISVKKVSWGVNSALISLNTLNSPNRLLIEYNLQGKNKSYYIELTEEPSNLKKGTIWFFKCPISTLKSKKLFLYNGTFINQKAIAKGIYKSQLKSKTKIPFLRSVELLLELEELYEKTEIKNFKKTYKGKQTKKHKKILSKINRLEKKTL